MKQISLKKIGIVFLVIFLLSRSRAIMEFLSGIDLNLDGILTLEPLRGCSAGSRYLVTVLFLAFCFVVIWKLFMNRKNKENNEN